MDRASPARRLGAMSRYEQSLDRQFYGGSTPPPRAFLHKLDDLMSQFDPLVADTRRPAPAALGRQQPFMYGLTRGNRIGIRTPSAIFVGRYRPTKSRFSRCALGLLRSDTALDLP